MYASKEEDDAASPTFESIRRLIEIASSSTFLESRQDLAYVVDALGCTAANRQVIIDAGTLNMLLELSSSPSSPSKLIAESWKCISGLLNNCAETRRQFVDDERGLKTALATVRKCSADCRLGIASCLHSICTHEPSSAGWAGWTELVRMAGSTVDLPMAQLAAGKTSGEISQTFQN